MRQIHTRTSLILAAVALLLMTALPSGAAMVAQMSFDEIIANSGRIFRGTVMDVEQSSVEAGGGELPVVEYTLRVDEAFKGDFDGDKETTVVVIRMLGSIKEVPASGEIQRVPVLPDLPRLEMGHDYVLFTTPPSTIGLSTTVGLGQGAFRVYTEAKQEMATNELGNAGIFQGPVSYAELASAIRQELGQ